LKIGQFHTFEIELETKITIYKEEWPLYEINLIKEIAREEHGVEIAAMVMEEGVAHLCYVKQSITLLKKKIERNISKKSSGDEIYRKSLNKFFQECYMIIRTLDFDRIKCFVIASPGFINDQLLRYIRAELEKENDKAKNRWVDKIILAKCSNGYLNSLNEVLADPTVMQKMENTKAVNQSRVLEEFYNVMKVHENRVAYGEKEVTRCIRMKAVQKLLISDFLFRNKDFEKRRNINKLYEEARNYNGQTVIFSSLHPSGEKLKNITGIAAILRFDVVP
jgi:protein pelota